MVRRRGNHRFPLPAPIPPFHPFLSATQHKLPVSFHPETSLVFTCPLLFDQKGQSRPDSPPSPLSATVGGEPHCCLFQSSLHPLLFYAPFRWINFVLPGYSGTFGISMIHFRLQDPSQRVAAPPPSFVSMKKLMKPIFVSHLFFPPLTPCVGCRPSHCPGRTSQTNTPPI